MQRRVNNDGGGGGEVERTLSWPI